MTFLFGTLAAGTVSALMILAGYTVAGFLGRENGLTRLALASLLGLAWVVFFASVAGALFPLQGFVAWLVWTPAAAALFVPESRRRLMADIAGGLKSPGLPGALAGVSLLWLALHLPFLVYPDLAFFDGKTNHDNFFWCIGAEYLQHHDYLHAAAKSREFPLYNLTWSFSGLQPAWARMAAEGYVAITSATFGQTPVRVYNFFVSALALPWILTTLAIAARMGLPPLRRLGLALAGGCQPILFFFIANGNLPNLLGAIFSGGLWLVALLLADARQPRWPLLTAGVFCLHGVLASYPEILLFALAPVGLLALRYAYIAASRRAFLLVAVGGIVLGGLCLNPLTTVRLWSGIQNSIGQVQQDHGWANIFARVTFAGYIPSLITLGVPSIRLYGVVGGLLASAAVLGSLAMLLRCSPRREELLFSLAGFFALLIFTAATSFGYGWQKSAQFFGIPLAVLFPGLLTSLAHERLRSSGTPRLALAALLGTLGVMVHTFIGVTAENLKSARHKGLTHGQLALREHVAADLPAQPLYVDGATFRAAFFQSMWSAKLFPQNPLVFLSRQDEAGGYLRDFVTLDNPTTPARSGRYYVATNWAKAFDYNPVPLAADRVGVLVAEHNLIPALTGFYRITGVPEMTQSEFSLTIYPYANGWLEFTLEPNGEAAANCELRGKVMTDAGAQAVTATLDPQKHLVVRFPLTAGTRNVVTAAITGGPTIDPERDDPPYPFRVVSVRSGKQP